MKSHIRQELFKCWETRTTNVDLYWPKAKIMIFGAENDEEYTIAAKSEWKCYYLGSEDVNADSILSALKEK